MIAPYYLNFTFRGMDISAKARMLHADGTKIYEIIFSTDEKVTLRPVTGRGGSRVWKDLKGNVNEFYQSLGEAIEQQDELP
ncbi:MAG: hypothetical protein KF862_06980 [Chitinophagaceae bacterium]|nr:hypothetical protein [Chitinophagaceae bacterium]